jgi:hypothetical protein
LVATPDGCDDPVWIGLPDERSRILIMLLDEAIDGGWFGPRVTDAARKRLGDVALLPFTDTSFEDAGDTGPFQLVCRHGSLTEAEVDVPLLAFRSNA